MTTSTPELVAFHYPFSPWGRKLTSYLSLRNIPYKSCHQPVTMPRPDLESLGIKYRRIPFLAIGKDIYCDTSLEIAKLETKFFPDSKEHPDLRSKTPEGTALEQLLDQWTESVGWKYAAYAIPVTLDAVFKNPEFLKDRTEMFGWEWSVDHHKKLRVQSDLVFRDHFDFLENTLLSDGRKWLVNTRRKEKEKDGDDDAGPGLADLHVGWLYDWMRDVGDCWPKDLDESSGNYPKFWAWLNRYRDAVAAARERLHAGELDSATAISQVINSTYADTDLTVQPNDPSGLTAGERVEGYPREYASQHRDKGKLVGLTQLETVIETEKHGIRVHHPRWLFQVEKASSSSSSSSS